MGIKVKANRHGFLAFRLYWNKLESWEGTGLRDTPANRKLLEAQATIINHEIEKGTFGYLKWFPKGNRAKLFQAEHKKAEPQTVRQYYKTWFVEKFRHSSKRAAAGNTSVTSARTFSNPRRQIHAPLRRTRDPRDQDRVDRKPRFIGKDSQERP
jgi:hypothetical protein